ncbi:hypothetical protein RFI_31067 [Reticulomyxa filosa]|uniref:Uncharacterized protein n=1 Tax=Reticulomyxa filosa TaxID=46433 RepID=X6M014_RETFI|nr:hypothetical protein RFI_31067 [Reticulomyxa filosa]|eukprot:ETO06330.1 hypothetical protein RFI_31067 [Reticulomyxa filosa]
MKTLTFFITWFSQVAVRLKNTTNVVSNEKYFLLHVAFAKNLKNSTNFNKQVRKVVKIFHPVAVDLFKTQQKLFCQDIKNKLKNNISQKIRQMPHICHRCHKWIIYHHFIFFILFFFTYLFYLLSPPVHHFVFAPFDLFKHNRLVYQNIKKIKKQFYFRKRSDRRVVTSYPKCIVKVFILFYYFFFFILHAFFIKRKKTNKKTHLTIGHAHMVQEKKNTKNKLKFLELFVPFAKKGKTKRTDNKCSMGKKKLNNNKLLTF